MKKIVSIAGFMLMISTASFAQNNTGNGTWSYDAENAQSKNASIQAISSVLKSYNQMYAGFKLTK